MGTAEEAGKLRATFGRMRFQERKNSGVRIVNSVTPSTRVRISIMKSITEAYKAANPGGAISLLSFLPRPVIRCRPRAQGPMKTYNFVEAVTLLGIAELGLTDTSFTKAYQIAGRRFSGEMEQNFLVLKDDSPLCVEERSEGRKRAAENSPGSNPARRQNIEEMEVVDIDLGPE